MIHALRVFLLSVLFVSCARSVTHVDPNEKIELSGRWNDSDSRQVAQKMIDELLGSDKYKAYATALGKKPAIIIGLVRNKPVSTSMLIITSKNLS